MPQSIIHREKRSVWEMADCHSADVAKCCLQPWCRSRGLKPHPIEPAPSRSAGWRHRASEARFPPGRAACHPLVSHADARSHIFPCCPAIAHPMRMWPGRTGVVCCVFLTGSLTLCHTAQPRCQPVHPTCKAGCRIRPLGTLLAPAPRKPLLAFHREQLLQHFEPSLFLY